MRKTCVVTGGAGFIGCAISRGLADRFERVIAIDNLHPQVHKSPQRPVALDERVELVVADVTDPATWDALLADVVPDTVVHLAAETGTGQSLTEATRHARVNVVGTTEMLDGFVRRDRLPERVILTSSRAVYGEGAWRDKDGVISYPGQRSRSMLERAEWDFPGLTALPFQSRTVAAHPTSVYGATKLAQEHVLSAWCLAMNVVPVIYRLQNVYGPGQSLSNPYTGIVSLFAQKARVGEVIPVYEDGEIVRDFVFIEDVAAAILAGCERTEPNQNAFDIGSGEATSILDLATMMAAHYGAPEPRINGMYRDGDVRHASSVIDDAKTDLGWQPQVMVRDGVARLADWIETQL